MYQNSRVQALQHEKTKDMTNLAFGEGGAKVRQSMGDAATKQMQSNVLSELTGETMKATPNDRGAFNFEKQPRKPINERTAFKYWVDGNISDVDMWNDWPEKMTQMGYTWDASSNSLVAAQNQEENSNGPVDSNSLQSELRKELSK